MRLVRTQFAYDEIASFVGERGGDSLIESYFVQYLLIAFYSEMEERLKEIVSARLRQVQDRKVASFIYKTNEAMIRRVKKAEINDILQKFDCGEGDVISDILDQNLQPYFDAIANRHLVSHDGGANMTLDEFKKALPCGEAILGAVELALAPD